MQALQVLEQPGALTGMLSWKVFSLSSFKINAALAKHQATFNTIFDIGANEGQFTLAAAHRFPMAQIYAFEPVPDTFQALVDNVRGHGQVHLNNCAIGNTKGRIKFYRNNYTQVSSALPIHNENNHPNYDQSDTRQIEVDIHPLDEVTANLKLRSPALLKIDAQGYEKEILRGAQTFLRGVDYILFEASFVHLYDQQPLFDEMHAYVKELGYVLVAPLDVHAGKDLALIEMDVLYRRL
jgi:FkbM family methyltransferase